MYKFFNNTPGLTTIEIEAYSRFARVVRDVMRDDTLTNVDKCEVIQRYMRDVLQPNLGPNVTVPPLRFP